MSKHGADTQAIREVLEFWCAVHPRVNVRSVHGNLTQEGTGASQQRSRKFEEFKIARVQFSTTGDEVSGVAGGKCRNVERSSDPALRTELVELWTE